MKSSFKIYRRKISHQCAICGRQYMAQEGSKYCGYACRVVVHRESERKRRAARQAKREPLPQQRACIVCNVSFRPKTKAHKYCSTQCTNKQKTRNRSLDRSKDREKEDPVIPCSVCQKPFKQTWPRHTAVTCSTRCSKRYTNSNYDREKNKFIQQHGEALWRANTKIRNASYRLRVELRRTHS